MDAATAREVKSIAEQTIRERRHFGVDLVLDHDPTDADFANARDGLTALNSTSDGFFVRTNGAWKSTVLT